MSDRPHFKWELWFMGMMAAFLSGGSGAVVSALTSMGIAPDKFNLSSLSGFTHLMELAGANFIVGGMLAFFLYLRQTPVPPQSTGNTEQFSNPNPPTLNK